MTEKSQGELLTEDKIPVTPQPITADEIVKPLAENMPPITEPTDAAPSEGLPEQQNEPISNLSNVNPGPTIPQYGMKDSGNNVFDAAKHKLDENGKPALNKKGRFISKFVGRPKGGKNIDSENSEKNVTKEVNSQKTIPRDQESLKFSDPISDPEIVQNEKQDIGKVDFYNRSGIPDEYDHAAELYLQMAYPLACGIISDEWQPENQAEHEQLKIPLAAYMRSTGKIELSPKMALTLAIVAFSGKRLNQPKTKNRIKELLATIKGWFKKKAE